jgi:predicted NAD/FAD-binding protein
MNQPRQRIAVIGSGISGLASAYFLQRIHEVTLFEANAYLGGHTNTVDIEFKGEKLSVDTGFLVFNEKTYPNLIALFEELQVESYASDMTFGVSLKEGATEWAGTNLSTVFAQKSNLFSLRFLLMIKDILRFNRSAEKYLQTSLQTSYSLQELLDQENYSEAFRKDYLIPMAAAIWSSTAKDILEFPASTFLQFCINHALLQVKDRPQWRTVKNGAREYVKKINTHLYDVRLNTPVQSVERVVNGVKVVLKDSIEYFDAVIFATHAPDTLRLLNDANGEEKTILRAVRYQANTAYLHSDISFMPKNKKVWSAWNYLETNSPNQETSELSKPVCVTYLLNQLQNLAVNDAVMVTLNPSAKPDKNKTFAQFEYDHPVFDQAAIQAQKKISNIQGQNKVWFAGAWTGYGFHEDGLKSALRVVSDFGLAPHWMKI